MLRHEFCLVPRGDTPSSGRLFGALACRCVPLVLSKTLDEHLPYRDAVAYENWTIAVPEGKFLAEPRATLELSIAAARPRLPSMRAAMESAALDLLYAVPGSRVADRMLSEWAGRCRVARRPAK